MELIAYKEPFLFIQMTVSDFSTHRDVSPQLITLGFFFCMTKDDQDCAAEVMQHVQTLMTSSR